MSYAQWSKFTQYIVNDKVLYDELVYKCILAVGPSATIPSIDKTHWTAQGSPSGTPPFGSRTFSAFSWTLDGTNGFYFADLKGVSSSLTATSKLSSTLEMYFGYTNAMVASAAGAWLIAAVPSSANGGTIRFFVSSGANPATQNKIFISWAVVAF
jgi:hypothetical protein